jgi:hypothetical protein
LRFRICSRVHFEPKNNEFFKIIYWFKDAIAQVQEFADVGISVKGTHYPPGREVLSIFYEYYYLKFSKF